MIHIKRLCEMRMEGWHTQSEIADKFKAKANELLRALEDAGYKGFHVSTSVTHFGVSVYIQGALGVKFRLSDHDVTNIHRIFGENHINLNTKPEYVLRVVKEAEELARERTKKFDAEHERIKTLDAKWERIRGHFEGLTFKHVDRTYQTMDAFLKKGEDNGVPRTNVFQKELEPGYGQTAYYYEWTEPIQKRNPLNPYQSYSKPTLKPSYDYIDAFDENKEKE